jgi:serine/threonine protein phosphatase 1
MPGRTFAIGDIHGCSVALKTLLEAIDPRPEDAVIVLGDVLDYGPDSKGVIEQLMVLHQTCRLILIEGNHETMLFQAPEGRDDYNYWLRCGGNATVACYPGRTHTMPIHPDHFRFLKSQCRDYYETDDHIFVHANYYPNRPMDEQSAQALRWEFVKPEQAARHYSGKTVVAGHTPQASGGILDLGFLVVIDTDASREGMLTALDVDSGEIIQANQVGRLRRSRRSKA